MNLLRNKKWNGINLLLCLSGDIPITTDTISNSCNPGCSESYSAECFVVLWILIWVISTALLVVGTPLCFQYVEARKLMKKKKEKDKKRAKNEKAKEPERENQPDQITKIEKT